MKIRTSGVLTAVMAAAFLWCGAASGAWWEDAEGNAWTYTLSGGKATVTAGPTTGAVSVPAAVGGYPVAAIGACAFQNATGITALAVANGVGSIGDSAFRGCTGLVTANLGTGVTNLGKWAFRECTALESVSFGPNMAAWGDGIFIGCTSLESMALPDALDRVPDALFSGCSALTNVTIGSHATRIGNGAFANCALKEVTVPGNVVQIDDAAFTSCTELERVTLREGVVYLEYGVFSGCTSLVDVELPDSLQEIGPNAFSGCTGLGSVEVPDHVTLIGNSAFSGCSGLTNLVPGAAVATIGNSAIQGCSGLSSLVLPGSVATIGNDAFRNCSGLTSLVLPDGLESVGSYAFYGCNALTRLQVPGAWAETPEKLSGASVPNGCVVYYGDPDWAFTVADGKATLTAGPTNGAVVIPSVVAGYPVVGLASFMYSRCPGVTSVVIPDFVESIGQQAFAYCTGLTNAAIDGAGGAAMGKRAFYGCSALKEVTFGGGAEIGEEAFQECPALEKVTIGNGVEGIGKGAFAQCTGLKEISFPGSLELVGQSAFSGCSGLTNLVIGAGVAAIGPSAFAQCTGLTTVVIPAGVESLGASAFYWCTGLTNFVIGPDVESIGAGAFYWCTGLASVVIPDSVTEVGDNLFQNSGLRQLEVPGSWWGSDKVSRIGIQVNCTVTYRGVDPLAVATTALPAGQAGTAYEAVLEATGGVGEYAWSLGDGSAALPAGMELTAGGVLRGTPAEDGTFALVVVATDSAGVAASKTLSLALAPEPSPWSYRVQNGAAILTGGPANGRVAIPAELGGYPVTSIASGAFRNHAGVTDVEIPGTVTNIGSIAFWGCNGLTNLVIHSGLVEIGTYAFLQCGQLRSVELPDSVRTIGNYAFKECSLLEEVSGGAGLVSIGEFVFQQCQALREWRVPDGVAAIPAGACRDCQALTNVTIGAGVESIGHNAFVNCSSLAELVVPDNVQSVGYSAFGGCTALARLEVPEAWREPNRLADAEVPAGCTVVYRAAPPTEQTVHFNANGGTCKRKSLTAVVGGTYTKLATASRGDFKFLGWFDAREGGTRVKIGMPVTTNAERTLYAHWGQTVTFDANGGRSKKTSLAAVVGETYTSLASASWDGRKFLGWYDARTGGDRVKIGMAVTAEAERTLYAHWEQTVRFDANGGTIKKTSMKCVIGETYTTLATASRKDYAFAGWYDAPEGGNRVRIGMPVTTDRERTLYAHWRAKASGTGLAISGFTAGETPRMEGARRASVPSFVLTFEAEADRVYELQWTPSLGGDWTTLRRWTAETDGETSVPAVLPADSPAGFFRVLEAPAE